MPTYPEKAATPETPEWRRIRAAMRTLIVNAPGGAKQGDRRAFARIQISVENIDVTGWLSSQTAPMQVYWCSRDGGFEMAGVGVADVLMADSRDATARVLADVARGIETGDAELRYYGGLRFYDLHPTDGLWRSFPACRFVLPRFELVREAGRTRLVCNLRPQGGEAEIQSALAQLDTLQFTPAPPDQPLHKPTGRDDCPDRAGWARNVSAALADLQDGALGKIVLARRSSLEFDAPPHATDLLRRLKDVTPECFHFGFQINRSEAFVGASPERLYRRRGRALETEAVAGTRPRSGDEQADAELGAELLHSDKDRREHEFVRDAIRATLEPVCRTLRSDSEMSLLKLARGQHLFTGFQGELREGLSDAALLGLLHPTPAVGGCPTDEAVRRIRQWEGFDRGWYAAPVGWIGRDAAEFAVAIRSALVRGNSLALFAGAGIVTGSTAEGEWDEIEHKIGDFIRILTGD